MLASCRCRLFVFLIACVCHPSPHYARCPAVFVTPLLRPAGTRCHLHTRLLLATAPGYPAPASQLPRLCPCNPALLRSTRTVAWGAAPAWAAGAWRRRRHPCCCIFSFVPCAFFASVAAAATAPCHAMAALRFARWCPGRHAAAGVCAATPQRRVPARHAPRAPLSPCACSCCPLPPPPPPPPPSAFVCPIARATTHM